MISFPAVSFLRNSDELSCTQHRIHLGSRLGIRGIQKAQVVQSQAVCGGQTDPGFANSANTSPVREPPRNN